MKRPWPLSLLLLVLWMIFVILALTYGPPLVYELFYEDLVRETIQEELRK